MQNNLRAERARSFERIGVEYHRLRPRYPEEVVDWMVPEGARRVLDLGAGTGILTDALVARGLQVVAVEPSGQMLAVLRERQPEVECRAGTAEALPLPDADVDAVVVGQAWHWMDAARAGVEIARVLRPGGWLAMAWNKDEVDEPWLAEFERVQRVPRGQELNTRDRDPHPGARFAPFERKTVNWRRETTGEDFLQLHKTHSAWLVSDEATRSSRERQWRRILSEADREGAITVPYSTEAWRTRLVA